MSDRPREQSAHDAHDASATSDSTDGDQIMIEPGGHIDAAVVSAWLDTPDDFSEQDRLTIETHLADCAECRLIAAELTAIVRAFQTLPMVETPHSFGLTPEQAGLVATPTIPASTQQARPVVPRERTAVPATVPWYARQMRSLRWATAVASLLFVFLFGADLIGNVDTSRGSDGDAMIAMEAPALAPQSEDTTSTTSAAMTESEESERSSAPEPPAAGAQEESATDSAAGGSMQAEDESAESDDASPDTSETLVTKETPLTGEAELDQQEDLSATAYGTQQDIAESDEGSTLRLLQLALAITIAWLIVAMIALPHLRNPRI